MEQHAQERDDIKLYLLGLLPQERQPSLEERLLTDAAFYEELLIVEDELIDQYLAGELTERERQAFKSHFMDAPERRQQVRFATTLRRYVADEGAVAGVTTAESSRETIREVEIIGQRRGLLSWLRARNPALAFSMAAAALLLVFGASWIAMRVLRPRPPGQVLTVMLTPDVHTRSGGDVQQVVIPNSTDTLRLQLRLAADDFQSYNATLLNADGATVLTTDDLKSEQAGGGRFINVSVPAQATPPGEYQLKLNGIYADGRTENADSYRLKVAAR